MINGVIFDMDGTMFDTERMWATFWDPALKALGLPYKEGLAEAARGTAGENTRNVVRSFYGPDCDADGIVESLHRVADEVFLSAPVPKKPGLDALLAWLDEQHLPMAVASSSREAMTAEKLGVEPARCLVLEDSYNGVRAGARGGFITVMVPDLVPADDEMRSLYTMECASLDEVLEKLKNDQL